MLPIKHILFPVDFSDRCVTAIPFVQSMAQRFGAKITVLSTVQPFYYGSMGDPSQLVMVEPDTLLGALNTRLERVLSDFPGMQAAKHAELGDAADAIITFAESNAVDLIMMPTHGYGPFRSLLLGSVAAKVLHDAKCPVWTAAHETQPPSRDHLNPVTVLCAVEANTESVGLMQWAAEFSKTAGATLKLVHVVPGMESFPASQMNQQFELDMKLEAKEQITKLQATAGVDAPLCVEAGSVAGAVRDEALNQNAGLVVIGRGVLHETLGRLRTNAYGIIRHAPCPVLSV
jgi:nucleotide-binding universal stress UspA family protein